MTYSWDFYSVFAARRDAGDSLGNAVLGIDQEDIMENAPP